MVEVWVHSALQLLFVCLLVRHALFTGEMGFEDDCRPIQDVNLHPFCLAIKCSFTAL